MDHLELHNILSDNQHGLKKHRSCETQLGNTIKSVAKSLDNKEQVDMLILDFSKAFNTLTCFNPCHINAFYSRWNTMVSVVEFFTGLGPDSRTGTRGCAWTET